MQEWIFTIAPSLLCGGILWYIKRYFDSRDKKEEQRENARVRNNALLLKGVSASLSLGDATAEAIETSHWNGEMQEARRNAKQVKTDIDNFVYEQSSRQTM